MYQSTTIAGNLGRDPEMRYTPAGKAVTNFNVATGRQYTGADGNQVKETVWFRVTTWGKTAEACNQYLKKGQKVLVEGRLNCDPATGGPVVFAKKDGTSGASFEITANVVRFLSSKEDGPAHANEAPAQSNDGWPSGSDVPF